ncbi:MAG: hypothetical protein K1X31_13595 [Gemmatimonadaceae bacterium]|nr:hypothetical protein [Gemmatimonadaceae bacterium]
MSQYDEIVQPHVGIIEHGGRRFSVSLRIAWDGIEYVGRLWFADEAWDDLGIPDRGAFPGKSRDECLTMARGLTEPDLVKRYKRALAEKRRYKGLRKHTEEILAKIRYLNQVAVSMRAGLLDVDGAAQEIDLTEQQLHTLIDQLGTHAGVEQN